MGSGRRAVLALAMAVVLVAGSCGDYGESADGPSADAASTTGGGAGTTVPVADEPLRVLVTNDDGVAAEGIDQVVVALTALPEVEVTVVAPVENQSGSGDRTSEGQAAAQPATTASGYEAVSVDGFPADSVVHALEVMDLDPHVVVSGVNEGANIGPFAAISGTVGAAKTAARAGYPALALSQGYGTPPDYEVTVDFGVEWIQEHRDALVAGTAPVEVISINGPTCPDGGEAAGLLEVELADDFAGRDPLVITCDGGPPPDADDDVGVYIEGWASQTAIEHEPTAEEDPADAATEPTDGEAGAGAGAEAVDAGT